MVGECAKIQNADNILVILHDDFDFLHRNPAATYFRFIDRELSLNELVKLNAAIFSSCGVRVYHSNVCEGWLFFEKDNMEKIIAKFEKIEPENVNKPETKKADDFMEELKSLYVQHEIGKIDIGIIKQELRRLASEGQKSASFSFQTYQPQDTDQSINICISTESFYKLACKIPFDITVDSKVKQAIYDKIHSEIPFTDKEKKIWRWV